MTQQKQVNEPRHLPTGRDDWNENRSDRNYMLSARFQAFTAMQMKAAVLWVVARRRLAWRRRFETRYRCQPSTVKRQWETNPGFLGHLETRNGKHTMSRNDCAKPTYNSFLSVLTLEEGTDMQTWTVNGHRDPWIWIYSAFGKSLCAYKRCRKWCPRVSLQAWTRLILFANNLWRSAFGKSLCTYKSCWKWCPRASIKALTRLILFANTSFRSSCEMFLMNEVIADFN
jgi:hypothetical protein